MSAIPGAARTCVYRTEYAAARARPDPHPGPACAPFAKNANRGGNTPLPCRLLSRSTPSEASGFPMGEPLPLRFRGASRGPGVGATRTAYRASTTASAVNSWAATSAMGTARAVNCSNEVATTKAATIPMGSGRRRQRGGQINAVSAMVRIRLNMPSHRFNENIAASPPRRYARASSTLYPGGQTVGARPSAFGRT